MRGSKIEQFFAYDYALDSSHIWLIKTLGGKMESIYAKWDEEEDEEEDDTDDDW